jgi:hypothetical protein
MKKLLGFLGILALLAGCSSPVTPPSGNSVTFTIPTGAGSGSRALQSNEARLWLFNGGVLYPNGAQGYYSTGFSGTAASLTVAGIPDAADYSVVVVVGAVTTSGFMPTAYASSAPFSVATGAQTDVNLTLKNLTGALATALNSTDVVSIKEVGSTLYAASPTTLYSSATTGLAGLPNLANPVPLATGTIHSLTAGYDIPTATPFLLVNTTNGVYKGGVSDLVAASTPTQPDVTWSGAVSWTAPVSGSTVPFYTYFFMGPTSLGGVYSVASDPGAASNTSSWRSVDLSQIPGINGNPLLDFVVTSTGSGASTVVYGFFATRILGTVRVNSAWLQQGGVLSLSDLMDTSKGYFQYVGSGLPLIQALGLVSDPSLATKNLYLGTQGGAYMIPDATATTLATPALLPETRGFNITRIVTDNAGDIAFLSTNDIFIKPAGKALLRLPFVASVVGTLQDARWSPGTQGLLYVAGTSGALGIQTGALE